MLHVCPGCGAFRQNKIIVPAAETVICPACGLELAHPRLPLFILGGASGTGKSAVCHALLARRPGYIVLDSDVLWGPEFAAPAQWPRYVDLWLRLAKSIALSGRPLLIAGAGLGVPTNLVHAPEARYLTAIHILTLVCADPVLAARLRHRPAWRGAADPAAIDTQLHFNRWNQRLRSSPEAEVVHFDTTSVPLDATVAFVDDWVRRRWLPLAPGAGEG